MSLILSLFYFGCLFARSSTKFVARYNFIKYNALKFNKNIEIHTQKYG